jgi:hypothetical protein
MTIRSKIISTIILEGIMKFYIQQLLRNKLINTRKGKSDEKICNDFNSSITNC